MIHHVAAEVRKATLARRRGFWWSLVVAAAADSAARGPEDHETRPDHQMHDPDGGVRSGLGARYDKSLHAWKGDNDDQTFF